MYHSLVSSITDLYITEENVKCTGSGLGVWLPILRVSCAHARGCYKWLIYGPNGIDV